MELKNPFEKIVELRKRIGGKDTSDKYGVELDPIDAIKIRLEEEGIPVERPEEIDTEFGPFLTYKGDALAILYIFDSNSSYDDLISESLDKRAPKFHFSWCSTLEEMEKRGRFARYILSRRKVNKFAVQAKEIEPSQIHIHGENHVMEDVSLYACKNCLNETKYKGYHKGRSKDEKNKRVEEFNIQDFLDEHEGTFNTWKFYRTQHTDKNVPLNVYTSSFPEISRFLRESSSWKCSRCSVSMINKKEGLHVHHRNGVKNDDKLNNLQVLCALCHKNIDSSHKRMYVSPIIEKFIIKNR